MRPETGFALRDLWPVSRWKWAGNRVHPAGRSQIQCWRKLPLSDAGLLFFKDPLDGSTEREPLLLTSEEQSRKSPADAAGRTGAGALWWSCSYSSWSLHRADGGVAMRNRIKMIQQTEVQLTSSHVGLFLLVPEGRHVQSPSCHGNSQMWPPGLCKSCSLGGFTWRCKHACVSVR